MLRNWKAQKTNAALRAAGMTRLFRRPFGARECNPARRCGATRMSPPCTILGSAPNAKRPTEAVELTTRAFLETQPPSSAGRARGREAPPEKRRGRSWRRSGSRDRWRAPDGRVERAVVRQDRADDVRARGHETMETHARIVPPCSDDTTAIPAGALDFEAEIRLETRRFGTTRLERLGRRRRSYEQRSSDKTSDSHRATQGPAPQGSHSRAFITRVGIEQAMSRSTRISSTRMEKCALARPPRKLLRVNGLGDKLGYPRATFVPPLIFLHQS
jgi:hypothetical protein